MKNRSIESRLQNVEKNMKGVPHCLSFYIAEKDVGYRCEVMRWDSFGGWALSPERREEHYLGRIVKDFDQLQDAVDFIDDFYINYKRSYGVSCTAQLLELNFAPTDKQNKIMKGMKKHLLWLGSDREI